MGPTTTYASRVEHVLQEAEVARDVVGPPSEAIRIRGARAHNLRNVDIDIPRNQLVVLTGPSGSGKSSLAFDTLYAEGKRQYIESLSVQARQFLDQVARPDVDVIDGLQPTLCIDQRPGSQNPRSTVATITEVYDYLRLLFARLGQATCYHCGEPIQQQTPDQIVARLSSFAEGTKAMLLAPLVRGRKGLHKDVIERVRRAGFVRVRVDGMVCEIDSMPKLTAQKLHHIDAVIDRVILRENIESRLAESVRVALEHGDGLMTVCYQDENESPPHDHDPQAGPWIPPWRDEIFSITYACARCAISYEEVEPRTFSFNSPYGACPVCQGLGVHEQFDPELVIPDQQRPIGTNCVVAWSNAPAALKKKHEAAVSAFVKQHRVKEGTPLAACSPELNDKFLHGDEAAFPGVLLLLEKEFATAMSKKRLAELARYRAAATCQACHGSRLRREATSVLLAGNSIVDVVNLPLAQAREWFEALRFDDECEPVGRPLVEAIVKRLHFLMQVGVDYLTLGRAADTLSGGEFQRVRLATSLGSGLVGVCYVLDEPSIGLHHRDNERLIASLRDLRDQGNTVLVVEHDDAVMRVADQLIDMGPGAGAAGGTIVAIGTPDEVSQQPASLTGRFLLGSERIAVPAQRRRIAKSRSLLIRGVATHNLQGVDVRIPLGAFVCVTGVSGSGKSSLINETLAPALARRMGQGGPPPGPFQGLQGAEPN